MKKLLLFLGVVIFCNHTLQGQPIPPSTTPYTRTLLPLPTQAAWQNALGITGGGGGGSTSNLVTYVPFVIYTNVAFGSLQTNATGYPEIVMSTVTLSGNGSSSGGSTALSINLGPGTNFSFGGFIQSNNVIQGIATATITNNGIWQLITTTVNGTLVSVTNTVVYGVMPVTNIIGGGSGGTGTLVTNFVTTNTSMATASAALTALGGLNLSGVNVYTGASNTWNGIQWGIAVQTNVGTGTITSALFSSNIIAGTSGAFNNFPIGTQLYWTNASGQNQQSYVLRVVNGTTIVATGGTVYGATNATWQYSFPTYIWTDTDSRPMAGVEADGTIFTQAGNYTQNSTGGGYFIYNNTTTSVPHSWLITAESPGGIQGDDFVINSVVHGYDIFYLADTANYASLGVLPNSEVAIFDGITNINGATIPMWNPVNFTSSFELAGSYGSAGQLATSTGSGVAWSNSPTSFTSLQLASGTSPTIITNGTGNSSGIGSGGTASLAGNSDDNIQIATLVFAGTPAANALIAQVNYGATLSVTNRGVWPSDMSASDAALLGPSRTIFYTNFTTTSYQIWSGNAAPAAGTLVVGLLGVK